LASVYQTLSNVYTDVRELSNKDSTTLSDANLLRIANKYYLWMVRELVDLNEDLYAEISYTDLVEDQQEYPLPVDSTESAYGGGLIKLQRVEINYSGSSGGWRVADPISAQEIYSATITSTDINDRFTIDNPKYTFKDRSLFIYPIPDSDSDTASDNANLYIYWIKRKDEMTTSADIPKIPKDFLNILAEGMLTDVYRKFGRNKDAQLSQRNWETLLARMRELAQSPDVDQPFIFKRQRENYR